MAERDLQLRARGHAPLAPPEPGRLKSKTGESSRRRRCVCGLVGLRGRRPYLHTSNRARIPKARHEAIGERRTVELCPAPAEPCKNRGLAADAANATACGMGREEKE